MSDCGAPSPAPRPERPGAVPWARAGRELPPLRRRLRVAACVGSGVPAEVRSGAAPDAAGAALRVGAEAAERGWGRAWARWLCGQPVGGGCCRLFQG